MTTAFMLGGEKEWEAELGMRFNLPRVRCSGCKETWAEGMVDYPALDFEFLSAEKYNYQRVVTVSEFRRIRDRICRAAGREINLLPGAEIGKYRGTVGTGKLNDFIWGRICVPQISKRACEILAEEGISLVTAEMDMRRGAAHVASHLALQIEPANVLTEEAMRFYGLSECKVCGNLQRGGQRELKRPGNYIIDRSKWPAETHMVMMHATNEVLVSEKFMEVVRRRKLTGLEFVPCGRFST